MLSAGQSPLELRHYLLIEQLIQRENETHGVALNLPDALTVKRDGNTLIFQREDELEKHVVPQGISEEVVLPIAGKIVLHGTPWTAIVEELSEETMQRVRATLERQEWQHVWHILPATIHTVYLDADYVGRTGKSLHIRTRRPGDVLRPLGMVHEKKVQDILIDKHIPRAQRDTLPLFFNADGHPVWLGGICIDDHARLTEHTQHVICLSIKATEEQA